MDSISTMFHLFRMATVVEFVALNSNSIAFDELPPALPGERERVRDSKFCKFGQNGATVQLKHDMQ